MEANARSGTLARRVLAAGALLLGLYFGWVSFLHFAHECGAMVPPLEVVAVLLLAGALLVTALVAALQSGPGPRSVATTSFASGALIVLGLLVGYFMTPVLGLDPESGCRSAASRPAAGTVSITLNGEPDL